MNKEERYLKFASSISFFEFIQEEFNSKGLNVLDYKKEIQVIESGKINNLEDLKEKIKDYPRIFDVFEQIFQLYRFTNTQLINFLFNIEILNSANAKLILQYLDENLKMDLHFKLVFDKILQGDLKGKLEFTNVKSTKDDLMIKAFKEAIVIYIEKAENKKELVYLRLKNYDNSRNRFANYLIDKLKLNDMLESIRLEAYLKNKRIPKDTKSIHGKYGVIKIGKILEEMKFLNADKRFKEIKLNELDDSLPEDLLSDLKGKWIYVTEKYLKSLKKDGKKKKFDFILIYDLNLKYAIETNFYSTSGTKIGINEGEYVELNKEIKQKIPQVKFMWITDGNYWLTNTGESMFKRCFDTFGENILSYNLFRKRLELIKNG